MCSIVPYGMFCKKDQSKRALKTAGTTHGNPHVFGMELESEETWQGEMTTGDKAARARRMEAMSNG